MLLRQTADAGRNPLTLEEMPAPEPGPGDVRVRVRGTVGGSLSHNDPAAELPLVMAVLEAELTGNGPGGSRTIPWSEFPLTYFTTSLREEEMLTWIRLPKLGRGWGFGFHEVVRRAGDFAIVAAAAAVRLCIRSIVTRP